VRLTRKGEAEARRYDKLSDSRAGQLLAGHPRPQALLAAMDLAASALGRERIGIVEADPASPEARGLGLARRLMDEAEARARALGMAVLRLDTNRALPEALALYRVAGWHEVPAFNDEPYAHHWFEKAL
jgi:GNAT superfamily N-acetyltransferase